MIREYIFSRSVAETVRVLDDNNGQARIIAGGTDLMIDLANETVETEVLVDITRLEGFSDIILENGFIIIGAGVTMSDLAANSIINCAVSSLAAAAGSVGSMQIRNIATVAGNIIRAQPAADTAVILAALDAKITVCGMEGKKDIPLLDTYIRAGQSVVDAKKEIAVKIFFKAPQNNQGAAYVRLAQRKALALPILNVGSMLSVKKGKIEWARIVMAPVGIKLTRATEAENFLAGKTPSEATLQEAGALAVKNAEPRDSLIRGGKEYRLAVLPKLVTRALTESVQEIIAKGGMNL